MTLNANKFSVNPDSLRDVADFINSNRPAMEQSLAKIEENFANLIQYFTGDAYVAFLKSHQSKWDKPYHRFSQLHDALYSTFDNANKNYTQAKKFSTDIWSGK